MSAIKRIDTGHPAYQAALHRMTRYPANYVTLTTSSRKRLRPSVPHRKLGRGKVGIGGMRSGK
jgi:hypothetical protein